MLATALEALVGAVLEGDGAAAILRLMSHLGVDQYPVVILTLNLYPVITE
jgi:hypothetical protein